MENVKELIQNRRSVRTFDGRVVSEEDMQKLSSFMAEIENPYGIPVEFRLLDANKEGLSSPVVSGENLYVGAKVKCVPHMEEALGFSFEMLVLYAQSLGIGTVWIGGTMKRSLFERAMQLGEDERMPCVSPLGYPAEKMSLREGMMRKTVGADKRKAFEKLFSDGAYGVPLTEENAGRLAEPLTMVQLAPSAVNKQPWRVVVDTDAIHFYLRRDKGFVGEATGDLQKIDMGIALCHFALSAKEKGWNISLQMDDPEIVVASNIEYIATYRIS